MLLTHLPINYLRKFSKALLLCGSVFLSLFGMSVAQAATLAVVLSEDASPYHEVADAIEMNLGSEHSVIRILANKLSVSDSALSRARLIVTVGVKASELVTERGGKTPLLSVLVTDDWFRESGRTQLTRGGRNAGVIVLDQPYSRQFQLVRAAFPEARKIGVVVGKQSVRQMAELEKAAIAHELTVVSSVVESESKLVEILGKVLAEADLLLAVPDPDVLNRNTVQSVLMTTYRYRDPMLGYSKSLSRAGALVSLYSSPKQIGRQAGEVAAIVLNGGKLPGLQWPKYFSVLVNAHVARSLGIRIPEEEKLAQELGAEND